MQILNFCTRHILPVYLGGGVSGSGKWWQTMKITYNPKFTIYFLRSPIVPGRVPENPRTRTFEVKPDKPEPEKLEKLQTRWNPNPKFKPAGTRSFKICFKYQKNVVKINSIWKFFTEKLLFLRKKCSFGHVFPWFLMFWLWFWKIFSKIIRYF